MLSTRHGSERGFGLIELIVAVVMLSIVLGAMATASVVSSNSTIRSQETLKLAAALEQAVEKVQLDRPWVIGRVNDCRDLNRRNTCRYEFPISSTELYDLRATVVVNRHGTDNNSYDVSVDVGAFNAGTTVPAVGVTPVHTAFVKDLRKLETGDLVVASCRVEQADERMAAGMCPTGSTWTHMIEPHGIQPNSPNKSGSTTWLLPPFQSHGVTSDNVAWEEVERDGRNYIEFLSNPFTARVRDARGAVVDVKTNARGQWKFTGLVKGEYTVEIDETNNVAGSFNFWARKSTGNRNKTTGRYSIHITPGTQARIVRLWEPEPVTVTMRVKTGDSAIHWEPRWYQNSVRNTDNRHARAMLMPFPEGRVDIPGVSAEDYNNCSRPGLRNTKYEVCEDGWGVLDNGTTTITMRGVRPGLYQANWYHSFKTDEGWQFRKRTISKSNLGITGARWDSTFASHGRLGYIYVHRNGTISTANSSTGTGTPPSGPRGSTIASQDNNVAVRYPGCSNRRDLLTKLFREVPDSPLDDGTKRWVFHRPFDGKVLPQSLWDQLSPSLKAEMQRHTGDAALGWIKRVDRDNWVPAAKEGMSTYVAANGGWDDAKYIIQWQVNRFKEWQWTGWNGYPGGGHNTYTSNGWIVHYRHQKGDGTWVNHGTSFPSTAYGNGRPVQWNGRYPTYHGYPPDEDQYWKDNKPGFVHSQDKYRSRKEYIGPGDYRYPVDANVLYKKYSGVGVTRFSMYDSCNSPNLELDTDGNGVV